MIEPGSPILAADFRGLIMMWAGSSIPSGWLECNGDAISRTTYAALFAIIGTSYGEGDGSTTFNIPDLRGSVPVGAGQKTIIIAATTDAADVSVANDTIDFDTAHGLTTTQLVEITSSGEIMTMLTPASSSTSVDGSGNINIGANMSSDDLPVGRKIRMLTQSSTNFSAPADYYVIANAGNTFQVSSTPGGSIAGSGNSGSLTYSVYVPLRISQTGSGTCANVGTGEFSMANFSVKFEVGDEVIITALQSISGITNPGSSGYLQTYYVIAVDTNADTFTISDSPGGSAVGSASGGGPSITVTHYRPGKAYVIRESATQLKLANSLQDSMDGIDIDFAEIPTASITLTLSRDLADRVLGEEGGEEDHILTIAEMPTHNHRIFQDNPDVAGFTETSGLRINSEGSGTAYPTEYKGENVPHNNMPPFVVVKYIIKS